MALNINGTTGISGVDGSASAPALQGTDSNTGVSFGTDTVNINTGGVTRATVDSSGRVLIGTTTLGDSGSDDLIVSSSAGTGMTIRSGSSSNGIIHFADATSGGGEYVGAILYSHSSNFMRFDTDGSERMRIHSNGNLTIGHTQASGNHHLGIALRQGGTSAFYTTGSNALDIGRGTNNGKVIQFNRSGTNVGDISVTTSSTSYNTSSDYRLKENVVGISDGITRLKTLKPSRFNFKADKDTTVDGFLAHEVTAVPEAITGTKDEVNSDNKPVYQGIDQSKLVPLLTAALQEAIAKIEVLETKVAALEAG